MESSSPAIEAPANPKYFPALPDQVVKAGDPGFSHNGHGILVRDLNPGTSAAGKANLDQQRRIPVVRHGETMAPDPGSG